MVKTSITGDLQFRTDAHRGASFLCLLNALQYTGRIAFKVKSPLVQRAITINQSWVFRYESRGSYQVASVTRCPMIEEWR
jgi:hypothetical protein